MIAAWYFCASIKSDPRQAGAWLSYLDTLEIDDSDDRVALACSRLSDCDVWQQAYALPILLHVVSTRSPMSAASIAGRALVMDIISSLQDDVVESMLALADAAFESSDAGKLGNAAIAAFRQVETFPSREPSLRPYIDMQRFLPEVVLLALLVEIARRGNREVGIERGEDAFAAWIDRALSHTFGRLPFLLAVDLELQRRRITPELLEQRIWSAPRCDAANEPDLLYAFAQVYWAQRSQKVTCTIDVLIDESYLLRQLHTRLNERERNHPRSRSERLDVIALADSDRDRTLLPVIGWQIALWELAVRIDPVAASDRLSPVLGWQTGVDLRKARFFGPLGRTASRWRAVAAELLALRRSETSVQSEEAVVVGMPTDLRWSLFSPWIRLDWDSKPSQRDIYRYPLQIGTVELIRLFCSAVIAVRLMRTIPDEAVAIPEVNAAKISALVVHAIDVCAMYGRFLRGYSEPNVRRRLADPHAALAAFADRQCRRAGYGHWEQVGPDRFVSILEQLQIARHVPEDVKIFAAEILPRSLFGLVADCYTTAIDESGPARWWEHLDSVYSYYTNRRDQRVFRDKKTLLQSELLMRFFGSTPYRGKAVGFLGQGLEGERAIKNWRSVMPRELLLQCRWTAEDWLREDWLEPDSDEKGVATRLIRAVERVAALADPGSLSIETQEKWRRDFADALDSISRPADLDRFLRLRLLELLEMEVLAHKPEEQLRIALLLLEYGAPRDKQQLLARLFPEDPDLWRLANGARWSVRKRFLRALMAVLANPPEREGGSRESERDTIDIDIDSQVRANGRETLRLISFRVNPFSSQEEEEVLDVLRRQFGEERRRNRQDASLVRAQVHVYRGRDCLVLGEDTEIPEWHIALATRDPNTPRAILMLDEPVVGSCKNLFELSRDEISALSVERDQTLEVVGIVVGKRRNHYSVNCGLDYYIFAGSTEPLSAGTPVRVHLRLNSERKPEWRHCEEKPIVRLERLRGRHADRRFAISINKERAGVNVSVDGVASFYAEAGSGDWDCDMSRQFAQCERSEWKGWAHQVGDRWVPVDQCLDQLLLGKWTNKEGRLKVLCFVGHGPERVGFRFQGNPGENYLLMEADFTEAALERIASEVRLPGARGLLVTVTPVVFSGRVRLDLASASTELSESAAVKRYDRLRCPFDHRNLEWRKLPALAGGEPALAERRSGWCVAVVPEIPGYPPCISIHWSKGRRPRREDNQVIVNVQRWDSAAQAAAKVGAEVVPTLRISYATGRNQAFYDKWMALSTGSRLRLKPSLLALNRDGFFYGRTDQNVRVLVEAESLTMGYIDDDFQLSEYRECEVSRIRRLEPRPEESKNIDITALPPALCNETEASGILVVVPHRRASPRLCKVLWKVGTSYFEHEMTLDGAPDRLELGTVVHLKRSPMGDPLLLFEARHITVRGLWSLHDSGEPMTNGSVYLGRATFNGVGVYLAEESHGQLLKIKSAPAEWQHLAVSSGGQCTGGLILGHRSPPVDNCSSGSERQSRERRLCRAHLEFPEGVLTGTCDAAGVQKRVAPQNVFLTLQRVSSQSQDGAEWYRLSRRFELIAHRSVRQVDSGEHRLGKVGEKQSAVDRYQKTLDDYFSAQIPVCLDATLLKSIGADGRTVSQVEIKPQRGQNFRFPADGDRWIPRVNLLPDEVPWISGAGYGADQCRVILIRSDSGYAASFRQVPPMSIEDFRRTVANSVAFGERIVLQTRMYYVGREKLTEAPVIDDPWWHRFEWGYGYTLLAPECDLRWNGEEFALAGLVLFHADSIGSVSFLTADDNAPLDESASLDDDVEDQHQSSGSRCLLSIEAADIRFSDARTLYYQRKKHRIVHLIKLTRRPGGGGDDAFEVNHVLGFDASAMFDSERRFRPGQQIILSGLEDIDGLRDDGYILARLDDRAYENALGLTVTFQCVAMDVSSQEEGGLEPGELVFMQAGTTVRMVNEIGLQLGAIEGFAGRMSREVSDLLILRRAFSVRQDLLGRIHNAELTAKELTGKLLLVKLSRTIQTDRVVADLAERMPPRRLAVLEHFAGQGRRMLATFAGFVPDDGEPASLRLELRPGVFVEIPVAVIDLLGPVNEGDIVGVTYTGSRYTVSRAASGDESFLPPEGRPAVVMPKSPLLRRNLLSRGEFREAAYWRMRCHFSVGGLPNLEPIAGRIDSRSRRWTSLSASEAIQLMATPHPRFAMLLRDAERERCVWLRPGLLDVIGGRLEANRESLSLVSIQSSSAVGEGGPPSHPIPWNLASFADQSIAEIRSRIERHHFTFHDTVSGHWVSDKGEGVESSEDRPALDVVTVTLEPCTAASGPIFAEMQGAEASLRYDLRGMLRFGFPHMELIEAFGKHDRRKTLHVAGVSARGGLWLELAPGRIAELPAQLLVRRAGGEEYSLARMHWNAFAPGDRITLEAASSDPLTIDRIALIDWQPGVRGAFGRSTAILPVMQPPDVASGSVVAGAEDFTLTLPYVRAVAPDCVALSPDNTLTGLHRLPMQKETVLLVVDEAGKPSIACYPFLRPVADRQNSAEFSDSPIDKMLAHSDVSKVRAIQAAGGAIPVTVSHVVEGKNLLFFHRGNQMASCRLPSGRVGLLFVVGCVDQLLVLRLGGGILTANIGEIVLGVPREYHEIVSDSLRKSRAAIWARRLDDHELVFRAEELPSNHEFIASAVTVVESQTANGSSVCGVICRDSANGALYWMPAEYAAWTLLTRDELVLLFQQRSFTVQIVSEKGRRFVSVIHAQAVQREFRQLKIGALLSVQIAGRRAGGLGQKSAYVVTTATSNTALLLEEDVEEHPIGAEVKVEVMRREDRPARLSVIRPGRKKLRLDLPAGMIREIKVPGSAEVEFLASGLVSDCEDSSILQMDPRGIFGRSPEQLDQLLGSLYWQVREARTVVSKILPLCSAVASEWYRVRVRDRELSVAHALMAVLLFDRVGAAGADRTANNYQRNKSKDRDGLIVLSEVFDKTVQDAEKLRDLHARKAVELSLDLGRRAARSRHVELLANAWLFYRDDEIQIKRRARSGYLWGRLNRLCSQISDGMEEEVLTYIRSVCDGIELRSLSADEQALKAESRHGAVWRAGLPGIAAALRASLGEASGSDFLMAGAPVMNKLASLLRSIPARSGGMTEQLDESHLAWMPDTIESIRANRWILYLLEPLPINSHFGSI